MKQGLISIAYLHEDCKTWIDIPVIGIKAVIVNKKLPRKLKKKLKKARKWNF